MGVLESVLIIEQFCRVHSGMGVAYSISMPGAYHLSEFGTPEQKEKYLIPFIKGEKLFSLSLTEPDHGCDLTTFSTTAVKKGDEYIINGSKTFISNGNISDFQAVLCQTDPEARHKGQSFILVEADREGFEANAIENKMGIKVSPVSEVFFNDVRVPIENLIGEENRGFYELFETLKGSRIEMAAQPLGMAQGAFEIALTHAKERKQFGRPIADLQIIRHKLADMAIKIESARLLVYKAAWCYDRGTGSHKLTSIAKVHASLVGMEVAEEAMRILGGYGYFLENEVERIYRDARSSIILEGTNEVQKNTIASELIGKL